MSETFRDGVLFFPVTPFDAADRPDLDVLAAHVSRGVDEGAAGVFAACGTGEYHALSVGEFGDVVTASVAAVGGRVPVFAGAGGPLGHARETARAAADAGAGGLLVMPPYLVQGPQHGLVAYIEAIAAATGLPIVVYHRANMALTEQTVERIVAIESVVGIKDGVGDVALMQRFVLAASRADRDLQFFNGLLTAELSQAAYRAIGVPLYSSAVFAMAPEIATAFSDAYRAGDDERQRELLDGFFVPLVRLRDETPGFAVSLIKAGLRLGGVPVGSVRPPLADPTPEQEERLRVLLERGRELVS
ncbi:5-dehydro-4-deoxyglucarate dehydratase [Microbacterium ulmi]|uniref:Probable 5-dehydro-4-deoxyglucarate dehydratase n=1 Tax=Microbacterium ulmi TaxID=179095 RepID=A0A7Y2M1I9_9MICO|nr:5-dehydro-4-deoxyglucarate dehydratase [Microbacterium ulmi]NII69047.1 5-dehydro-4-deoxyglucarate dehydratase [Microbacterium ulmi]NNH04627.1 5-dehydro-4-deoxyglucarate dehydratase [Microbacterium ulmi]